MQPENDIQNENVTPATESPVMAQGISEKKKSKGLLFGMILLAILAIGGIAFGVFEMLNGNTQKVSYEKQISDLKTQNNDLLDKIETSGSKDTAIDIEGDTNKVVDTAEYIYVGWWGMKIKIPEDLRTVSYKFMHGAGFTKLVVWGVDCSEDQCQYFPEFGDADKNNHGLGTIIRYAKGTEVSGGSIPDYVFSDEDYDYYYAHPQIATSMEQSNNNWEVKSAGLIEEMLSNQENYSGF